MLIEDLKAIVGSNGWKSDPEDLAPHVNEWRGLYVGRTPLLVAPASTDEVAAIVRRCGEEGVGIVPQGGNTGMCAAGIPDDSNRQIILSLARMNDILSVDADNFSIEVQAGCILQRVQEAAADAERYFPLSLGAEGSCQIGGNLATNAGGINVLRYGTARSQVLGLEVVLADGSVLDNVRTLRKDTAGYDLNQLFIGSEGTLGIITRAALRLYPDPGEMTTVMATLSKSGDAVRLLGRLQQQIPDRLEAFELISDRNLQLVTEHIDGAVSPFATSAPWYVLLQAATRDCQPQLESALAESLSSGLIQDAVLAKSDAEAAELWRLRHSIAEAERAGGSALKHDISVPIAKMQAFLDAGDQLLQRIAPSAELFAFGHVGDGNLHYNVRLASNERDGEQITRAIYDLVAEFGGSFSAEHGVGQMKRHWLPRYRGEAAVSLMKSLKAALDPDNTFNPGKVI